MIYFFCVLFCLIKDKQEMQCRQQMAGLDKVISDLDKQEKAIYTRVRPPLESARPFQDSADRLQDMKVCFSLQSNKPQKNYMCIRLCLKRSMLCVTFKGYQCSSLQDRAREILQSAGGKEFLGLKPKLYECFSASQQSRRSK